MEKKTYIPERTWHISWHIKCRSKCLLIYRLDLGKEFHVHWLTNLSTQIKMSSIQLRALSELRLPWIISDESQRQVTLLYNQEDGTSQHQRTSGSNPSRSFTNQETPHHGNHSGRWPHIPASLSSVWEAPQEKRYFWHWEAPFVD